VSFGTKSGNSSTAVSFNPIDTALLVIGLMSAFLLVRIATFDIFGVTFSAELFSVFGYSLSTAWVMGYAAVLGTLLTNDNTSFSTLNDDVRNLGEYYIATVVLTLTLPILFIVFPDSVGSFFLSEDLWGLMYVMIVTTGQGIMGWML